MKTLSKNKKAFQEYEIIKKYDAGIVLKGSEAKPARNGSFNLKDSYCRIKNGEMYLVNSHIAQYGPATINNHDPDRERKLLLHKKQIIRILTKVKGKGLTIIPLKVYLNDKNLIKVEIAIAKGIKEYQKKQKLKEKDIEREMDRYLKKNF